MEINILVSEVHCFSSEGVPSPDLGRERRCIARIW